MKSCSFITCEALHVCCACLLLCAFISEAQCTLQANQQQISQQPQNSQQPQPLYARQNYASVAEAGATSSASSSLPNALSTSRTRNYRQPVAAPNCEYKDVMTKLNDRVGILASLDEDQRMRLEAIDKKLTQFEAANLARLDSIAVQQTDFRKRLDSLEHIQRLTRTTVADLKVDLTRPTRQISVDAKMPEGVFSTTETKPTIEQKLNVLSTILATTAAAVTDLQYRLSANISRLIKTTNNLQRRLNNHKRHQQLPLDRQEPFNLYAPPAEIVTNCLQGQPVGNGILKIQLNAISDPFYVRCEDDGWLIILNRFSDDLNFERDWIEYKNGFGNLAGEHFIGLEKLNALTSSAVHELRIVLEDHDGVEAEARYSLFGIGNEQELYTLNLLGEFLSVSGLSAGDSLSYHAGAKFSTFDRDNDGCLECNCAALHKGGWWFNWCATSNLVGKYFTGNVSQVPSDQGMFWRSFRGQNYSLRKAKMLIRPVDISETRR